MKAFGEILNVEVHYENITFFEKLIAIYLQGITLVGSLGVVILLTYY